jgi:lysophospholipase L1-like esterase
MRTPIWYRIGKRLCALVLCALAAQASARDQRILVYGDSNTWGGQAVLSGIPVSRLPDAKRWTGVLQAQLGVRVAVVTDGLSGRTVDLSYPEPVATLQGEAFSGEHGLRLALARETPLDAVVIMLGTNDVQDEFNRTPEQIALGISTLVRIVRKDYAGIFTPYPQPKVLVVAPVPLGDVSKTPFKESFGGDAQRKSAQLASAIAQVAQRERFAVFDAGQVITRASGIDGIHLTPAEHARLGRALAPALRALIGMR